MQSASSNTSARVLAGPGRVGFLFHFGGHAHFFPDIQEIEGGRKRKTRLFPNERPISNDDAAKKGT